jgi:thioredoxin 1
MADNVIHLEDSTFDSKVLQSKLPVIVDFWAPWCAPCRVIAPVLEEVAQKYQGKVVVAKMNVDEHTKVATQYQITAIPTLLFFKDGKVAQQIVGAVPKAKVVEALEQLL